MSADTRPSSMAADFKGRFLEELRRTGNGGINGNDSKIQYMVETVQPIIMSMVRVLLAEQPADASSFLLDWLMEQTSLVVVLEKRGAPASLRDSIQSWINGTYAEPTDPQKRESEVFDGNQASKSEFEFDAEAEGEKEDACGEMPAFKTGRNSRGTACNIKPMELGAPSNSDPNAIPEGDEDDEDNYSMAMGTISQGGTEYYSPHTTESHGTGSGVKSCLTSKLSGAKKKDRRVTLSLWQAPPGQDENAEDAKVVEEKDCGNAPWQQRSNKGVGRERAQQMRQRRFTVALGSVKLPKMPDEDIVKLVRPLPCFSHLKDEQLTELAGFFECQRWDREEDVVTFGNDMHDFHVVTEGYGRVCVPQQIANVEIGSCFGEEVLKGTGHTWNRTVSATMGPLTTISIKGEVLESLGMGMMRMERSNAKKQAVAKQQMPTMVTSNDKNICSGSGGLPIKRHKEEAKTEQERQIIAGAVRSNRALTEVLQLSVEQLEYLIDSMYLVACPKGQALVTKGNPGSTCYVVNDGMFEVHVGDARYGTTEADFRLRAGDAFGELALLYDSPRAATVAAIRDSEVWVLTRDTFKLIMRMGLNSRIAEFGELVKDLAIFQTLGVENKDMIADAVEELHFLQGEEIVHQGEDCEGLFVIFEGVCEVTKDANGQPEQIGTMTRGEYFGEQVLTAQGRQTFPHPVSVRCWSDAATLLFIDKLTFGMVLRTVDDLKGRKSRVVRQSDIDSLNLDQKEKETEKALDHVDKQKALHECFHRGRASVMNSSIGATTNNAGGFGTDLGTVQEDGDGGLSREQFHRDSIEVLSKLGEGSFGYVALIADTITGQRFALKAMSKEHIAQEGLKEMVKNERSCQLLLDSPFVVHLYGTYQTQTHVFMVLEPCMGGELFELYNDEQLYRSAPHAMYYSACVALALEAIHGKRVIYRDLKMENLLLVDSGLCKITDMGLAKMILGKTYTVCGTADYFAPETLKQTGHNRAVDWWALGVLIFIMMAGRSPFDAEDVMQIYKNIVKGFSKVNFPKFFTSDLVDLIKSCCRKKPEERIAMAKGGVQNFKDHPFYGDFAWDKLMNEELEGPHKPQTMLSTPDEELIANQREKDPEVFTKMSNLRLADWDGSFVAVEEGSWALTKQPWKPRMSVSQ